MKAALLKKWKEMEVTELPKPVIDENEALIRVLFGGVCGSDITVYNGRHMTAVAPVVQCHEILGTIEKLPDGYTGDFALNDRVLMNPVISCGSCAACKAGFENVCENLKLLGIHENGGFAEYTKTRIPRMVKVDPYVPDHVAVLGEPFAVAYHVNRRAGVKPGDKVLIIGAGTIGIVVAMAAREYGADKVVVSEIKPERRALAERMGLETVDPAAVHILKYAADVTGGVKFDVVVDAAGARATSLQLPDLCRIRGNLVSLGLSGAAFEFCLGKISFREQTLIGSRLYSQEDFVSGVRMMEKLSRKYDLTAVVTDQMALDQAPEAIRMMMDGRNVGKIIIKCDA